MENNETLYYGEYKATITNINHLRDIEISILNYMLLSVENFNEITSKLDIDCAFLDFDDWRSVYHVARWGSALYPLSYLVACFALMADSELVLPFTGTTT